MAKNFRYREILAILFMLVFASGHYSYAQGTAETGAKLPADPAKFIYPDEYSELDAVPAPKISTDNQVFGVLERSRKKYMQAIALIEQGDTSKAAKFFEEAFNDLNIIASVPGIEQNDDYYELTQAIIEDYETYIQNIDDLGPNTPIFVLKDKIFADLESFKPTRKIKIKSLDKAALSPKKKSKYPHLDPPEKLTVVMADNEFVSKSMEFLTTTKRGRAFAKTVLERSSKWFPMMKKIAREENMPEEIVCLAMLESGLNPNAVSKASAVGLWQFMRETGKDYNLNVRNSAWIDERRDPEKATRAAMQYLGDLYADFGDWHLALASYNCGQGRVKRAIKQSKLENPDYWEIRKILPKETRDYVPQYISMTMIALNPEQYGFSLDSLNFQEPYQYDAVTVKEPVSTAALARCAGITEKELLAHNPELIKSCTPPDLESYKIKLPKGKSQDFAARFRLLSDEEKLPWVIHHVEKKETVSSIAKKFGIPAGNIVELNNLKNTKAKLRTGEEIRLPMTLVAYNDAKVKYEEKPEAELAETGEPVTHTVRAGESLFSIARRYGIDISSLRELNGMKSDDGNIRIGQTIIIANKEESIAAADKEEAPEVQTKKIPTTVKTSDVPLQSSVVKKKSENTSRVVKHKVKKGESLGRIADDYAVSIESIRVLNRLKGSNIKIGQVLKIETDADPSLAQKADRDAAKRAEKNVSVHKVKKGENLGLIAARYGITEEELKELNPKAIKGNTVITGTTLKVVPGDEDKGSSEAVSSKVNKTPKFYKVKKGETLSEVAGKFGLTIPQIKSKNKTIDENKLIVGQKIRLQ